jgi:hypothetical protein
VGTRGWALSLVLVAGCAGGSSPLPPCTLGPICADFPPCTPTQLCQQQVCEGKQWVCGPSNCGTGFAWLSVGAVPLACDSGDLCNTDGRCLGGSCVAVPMVCDAPPAAACLDASTLRTYATNGQCQQGVCTYTPLDTHCSQGCASATCTNEPCAGVICDKPLSVCYVAPGTCAGGTCSYTKRGAGEGCTTGVLCAPKGTCDGNGTCVAQPIDCSAPNTSAHCDLGFCSRECLAGFGDCDGDLPSPVSNGCETGLTNNSSHCGSCGVACGECTTCSGTSCVPLADGTHVAGHVASHRCCGGQLVNIATSELHCGGCGLKCASGYTCEGVGNTPQCDSHPSDTSGRCRCANGDDSLCPLNQNCRTDSPYPARCSPNADAKCLPGQSRWIPPDPTNHDCPRYCYYP